MNDHYPACGAGSGVLTSPGDGVGGILFNYCIEINVTKILFKKKPYVIQLYADSQLQGATQVSKTKQLFFKKKMFFNMCIIKKKKK